MEMAYLTHLSGGFFKTDDYSIIYEVSSLNSAHRGVNNVVVLKFRRVQIFFNDFDCFLIQECDDPYHSTVTKWENGVTRRNLTLRTDGLSFPSQEDLHLILTDRHGAGYFDGLFLWGWD